MVTICRRFTDKQGVYLTRELDASLQKFLQRDTRHTHARRWRRLLRSAALQLRPYAPTGDWAIRRTDRPASGGLHGAHTMEWSTPFYRSKPATRRDFLAQYFVFTMPLLWG